MAENSGFLECPLGEELRDKSFGDLIADNDILNFGYNMEGQKDAEDNEFVVQHWIGDGTDYATGNFVGVLGKFNHEGQKTDCVTITTRFGKQTNGDSSSFDQDFLLRYLVSQVLHIDVARNFDFTNLADSSWQQLLIMLFPFYLHQALSQGVYKSYMRREYDDSRPKGFIDIPRYIRKDMPFSGHISYVTRPFDVDNNITELIRHTVEYIAGLGSFGRRVLNYSGQVRNDVETVRTVTARYDKSERQNLVSWNLRHPVDKPYFKQYRILQRVCIAILQNRGFAPKDRNSGKIFGVLINCAWLWEEYLNQLCQSDAMSGSFIHPRNKMSQMKQYFFGGGNGEIYPDFIGRNDSGQNVVADAKYKRLKKNSSDDDEQLLSYMFRFDARKGQFWYPYLPDEADSSESDLSDRFNSLDESDEQDGGFSEGKPVYKAKVFTLRLLQGIDTEDRHTRFRDDSKDIIVKKIGLVIPTGCSDYSKFRAEMEQQAEAFCKAVNDNI
ncbi:hypothetical protein OZX72_04505 [Bifidobacterium sp. ESL0769]|uniref:5-methylcytosine restriction system specificity protein McrC n=1 Tax=Bifidobacterium sp. ESL0769 TaxID=2983229 RepID=UPI0023F873BE|nr:hypothetical protein [Bifidobacterium sp. ESL0769]WEV68242.1 hypothetical protein OZX72_04505 [Bifidobacterium sp. ESL0769]